MQRCTITMWGYTQHRGRLARYSLSISLITSFILPAPTLLYAQEVVPQEGETSATTTDDTTTKEIPTTPADPTTVDPAGTVIKPDKDKSNNGKNPNDPDNPDDPKQDPTQPPSTALGAGNYYNYENSRQWESSEPSVTPDESTGMLTLSYPIVVPPGRGDMQPDLALTYNSRNTDSTSIFGYGWSITIPSIERISRKGTDSMYDEYYFSSTFDGEIATTTTATTTYGAKVDNGSFMVYEYGSDTWTVTDKNGTVYTFGSATTSRIYDTGTTTANRIFKWLLAEVRDRNDNYITYTYQRNGNQLYPLRITYTGNGATAGVFDVEFTIAGRSDNQVSYATGFGITSNYRVTEIKTEINDNWTRKYTLGYTTGDNGYRSMLASITETGRAENGNTKALPATEFSYQKNTPRSWTYDSSYFIPTDFVDTNGVDRGIRVLDANGDALPDMPFATNYLFMNNADGTGWATSTAYTSPDDFYNPDGTIETRLLEANGDGLLDIARNDPNPHRLWINNGNDTGWSLASYGVPDDFGTITTDNGARIMDVDADGQHDVVRAKYGATNGVLMNDGDGTGWSTDAGYTIPVDFVDATGYAWTYSILDMNGDGLPDIAGTSDGYYNVGDSSGWTSGISLHGDFSSFTGEQAGRIFDANGDGLDDLVRSDTTDKQVYINRGDGNGWTNGISYTIPVTFADGTGEDTGVFIMDANGDGLNDIIQSKDANRKAYIHDGKVADLLVGVRDSKGASTTITYKASPQYTDGSGNLLNPRLQLTLQLVDTVTTEDPLGEGSSVSYTYGGGRYHFESSFKREFAGFATTTKTDADGFVTKTYFHQGTTTNANIGKFDDHISKKGKPYRVEVYDASGNLYSKTITQWDREYQGGDRNFVKKIREVTMLYDGDGDHKDTAVTYQYDDSTGNVTTRKEYGEVTGSDNGTFTDTGSDDFTTTISYAASTTLNLYLPSQETVVNSASTTVKDTIHYYDSLAQGSVSKGNETKTEFWKSGSSYIDTERTFNTYGLVTQEKDPKDKATTYVYDDYNLHIATSTNPVGHVTEFYRDFSSGNVIKTVDPNGYEFETHYDALDRPITEKQPDLDTPSTTATTTTYSYTDTQESRKVITTRYLSSATSTFTYTYLDGFDRMLQTRTEAEDGNYMVRDFVYDSRGQLQKESLPYFSSSTSRTATTSTGKLYTTYAYDPLNRVTTMGNAAGTTTHAYDQWEEVVTDANGNPQDYHRDAYGRLSSVEEHDDASTYTTSYEYNYLGNLTKITDAASNIRNFTYDGLGRRLTAQDLHDSGDATFGTWTYVYDPSGNLATTTDPKSQTIEYLYDGINRVVSEDYDGEASTEITYTYDNCNSGIGRLCGATTTDAGTNYTYNALGLIEREQKTIDATTYATTYTYDRQGNQSAITYPDGTLAQYEYNSAGLLEAVGKKESDETDITVLVSDIDYAPTTQRSYLKFASGVETEHTYDANELYRLRRTLTTAPAGGMGGMGGFDAPPGRERITRDELLTDPIPDENASATEDEQLPLIELTTATSGTAVSEPPETEAELPPSSEPADAEQEPAPAIVATSTEPTPTPDKETAPTEPVQEPLSQPQTQTAEASAVYTPPTDTATSISEFTALMATAQASYYSAHDTYFQGLANIAAAPTRDSNADWTSSPDDQAATWEDLGITLPAKTPYQVMSHVHDGAAGKGWQLVYRIKDGNVTYEQSIGYGAEAAARTWDWRVIADETKTPTATSTLSALLQPLAAFLFQYADAVASADYTRANGEYLSITDASQSGLDPTGDFTMEAWINLDTLPTDNEDEMWIMAKYESGTNRSYFLQLDTADALDLFWCDDASCSGGFSRHKSDSAYVTSSDIGEWVHVAVSVDVSAPDAVMYKDGSSVSSSQTSSNDTSVANVTAPFLVAGYNGTSNNVLDGQMDDARFWSDIRTSGEISSNMTNCDIGGSSNLVSWWKLDESSGTRTDSEGSNDLTDNNTVQSSDPAFSCAASQASTSPATSVTGSTATLNGVIRIANGSTDAGFEYAIDSDFTAAATTTTLTATSSAGSYSDSLSGITTFEEFGYKAFASSSGTDLIYGDVYQFFTADLSTSTPVVTADNHAWDNSTFDDGTHSGTTVSGTNLILSGSAPYSNGTWTSSSWNVGSITNVGNTHIEFSSTTPSDSSVVVKTAVNTSATTPPDSSAFATTTSGGTIAGISTSDDLTGKYLWVRAELNASSDNNNTPTLHNYILGINAASAAAASILQDINYTYDAVGNITQIADNSATGAGKTVAYTYDDLNRLTIASTTAASSTPFRHTYTYSNIGNITNKSNTGDYSYDEIGYANPHAATEIGNGTATTTYSYDNNGNMTGDGTTTNTWSYRNELSETSGATTTNYAYDHTSQRVQLGTPSATTTFANRYYNTSTNGTTTLHVMLPDGTILATMEGTGTATNTRTIHTDHLGSTNVVTDTAGGAVQTLDYYPFGTTRITSGSFNEQRKFIGEEYDGDTELSYLNARYYDGSRGQFISQDPVFLDMGTSGHSVRVLADPQLLNSYSYARNNPLVLRDQNGEEPLTIATIAGTILLLNWATLLYTGLQQQIRDYEIEVMRAYPEVYTPEQIKDAEEGDKKAEAIEAGTTAVGIVSSKGGAIFGVAGVANDIFGTGSSFDYSKLFNFLGGDFRYETTPTTLDANRPSNYGSQSTSQSRYDAVMRFNASSGASSPQDQLWVTPSGAVVTWEGGVIVSPSDSEQ